MGDCEVQRVNFRYIQHYCDNIQSILLIGAAIIFVNSFAFTINSKKYKIYKNVTQNYRILILRNC